MNGPGRPLRSLWPHVLLVVTFGVAGLVTLHAYRIQEAQKATAREALNDYGSFASWSYEQHATEELAHAFWQMLSPVNHGDALHVSPNVPGAADLAHLLPFDSAGCFCHVADYVPTAFFAFVLGSDSLDAAPNLHSRPPQGIRVQGADTVDLPEGMADRPDPRRFAEGERRWLLDSLAAHARQRYRPAERIGVVARGDPGGTALLGYTVMPTSWGDTLVYGLELPAREVTRLFDRVLDERDLLPPTFVGSRSNRDIVHATVLEPGGARMYTSGPPLDTDLFQTAAFPGHLGSLTLRTAISPRVAGDLIIGGLPPSRLPLMLGILGVAAALAVVAAAQVRKESRLARERTDFVSAVSHELRTPLAQIRLYLETLRLGRFRTEAQRDDALDRIDRETGRLAHLVENILQFARTEHGSGGGESSLLALAAEVRDAAETFAPLAAARDVEIELDLDGEAAVRADRRELRQVLINLLDNAVKYGPSGQTVTVTGHLDGDRAVLSVEDEGPGVAAGARDRIWEPFQRGDGPDERAVGGSGIGLSVVREIARRHGGDARVEESGTGGARFVVELPGERVTGAGRPSTLTVGSPG